MLNLFSIALLLNSFLVSGQEYTTSGQLESKIINYTNNTSNNLGSYSYFQIEQKVKFTPTLSALNQLKMNAMSLEEDVKTKSISNKKSIFDTYPGENYIRLQKSNFIFQFGFQEVVWGESFGFNFADIINPKDGRMTNYSDQGQSRIPILLLNTKFFIPFGSLQLIYGPRPQFSKTMPIDLFVSELIPQSTIHLTKEKTPKIFKENDYGFKLSSSFSGLDLSIFYFNFLNRDPYYTATAASLTDIYLSENHSRGNSTGVSIAKTFYDYVIRSDLVFSQNKTFNFIESQSLGNYKSNTTDILLSLDTPTFNKYSLFFIFASNLQSNFVNGSFSPKSDQFFITKISKSLGNEKTFEVSYSNEIKNGGNSIQGIINWPINNTTEIKIGGEFYFGSVDSSFTKIKKINNVFFGIKNFFQL